MFSTTFLVGICIFILSVIGIYFVRKWNDNKLTSEKKRIVDLLKWDIRKFSSQIDVALIAMITLISTVLIQKALNFEKLGFAVFIWLVGIFSLKVTFFKNKTLSSSGISSKYLKTNLRISYLFLILAILSGVIILFP